MHPLLPALAAACLAWQQPPPAVVPPMPADVGPRVTTASGLQYSVLKPGAENGEHARFGDRVTVHYTGWLADGAVFDSSRTGTPRTFFVGDVVEGWIEALRLMTPGAHWKLTVPPAIGYGVNGNPPVIPGNATLTFEIELLAIERTPDLPELPPANPALQKRTESGIVYEPIVEGTGPVPLPEEGVELKYAYWTPAGRLMDWSDKSGRTLKGPTARFRLRFLQLAPQYMKVGGKYRFEVPAELCQGLPFGTVALPKDAVTVWQLELLRAIDLKPPPFVAPDPTKQTTTASGLKYEVLKEGDGPAPAVGDQVAVKYAGWLPDGRLFDSSYPSGEPRTLKLSHGSLIKGWLEGVPLMKEGAIFRFEVPAALGYGAKGSPPRVPPNATILFQIELVKVTSLQPPPFVKPDASKQLSTPLGLKYEVLKEGSGKQPKVGDVVTVIYSGWLPDGTLFDSSVMQGVPATFALDPQGMIGGFIEGLTLMKEGALFRLEVPPELGYGAKGSPPDIPPGATLIFQIELVKVGR